MTYTEDNNSNPFEIEYNIDNYDFFNITNSMNHGRSTTGLSNQFTGFGTGRDTSNHIEVVEPYVLNYKDCSNLYRASRICKRIVNTFPLEASWGKVSLSSQRYKNYGTTVENIDNFFKNLRKGSLETNFRNAAIEARLHGESFLLLGVEDGQEYDRPLNENNIQSFEWVYLLTRKEVNFIDNRPGFYQIELTPKQSSEQLFDEKDIVKFVVHESRVIKFVGDYLPPSIYYETKKHDSSLQATFDGFVMAISAYMSVNAMISDHSMFVYAVDNLRQIKQHKQDQLYQYFFGMMLQRSSAKGFAIDRKSEEVSFINRNYGGLKDLLDTMTEYMVAESGMVRYKVMGSSQPSGLGSESRGMQDRLQHSLDIKMFQRNCWTDNYERCLKLMFLAKNSFTNGRIPVTNYDVIYDSVLELTPDEMVNIMAKSTEFVTKQIDKKILSPLEVRLSLHGQTEPIIIPNIALDDEYTQFLMNEQIRLGVEEDNEANEELELTDPEFDDSREEESDEILTDINPILGEDQTETFINPPNLDRVDCSEWFYQNDSGELIEYKEDGTFKYLVWFCDANGSNKHRTPIAVSVTASNRTEARSKAAKAARKKCTRHCERIYGMRQPTASEIKTASRGGWIRTGAKGQKTGYKGIKGVGAKLKNDSTDDRDNSNDYNFELNQKERDRVDAYLESLNVKREDVNNAMEDL